MPLAMSFGRRGWPISLRKSRISNARSRPLARRLMVSSVMAVSGPVKGLKSQQMSPLWRGSLLPLGCVAAPKKRERFALQREQAPSPQRVSSLQVAVDHLAFFLVGHAINLDLAIDHHVRLHTGPRRGVFRAEVLAEHFVEAPEVPWVFQPHTYTHHVFQRVAGFFENRYHVAHRLAGLLNDAARDDFTVHRRHLARHVQPAIRFHRTGERTRLTTASGGSGAVTSNAHNGSPETSELKTNVLEKFRQS